MILWKSLNGFYIVVITILFTSTAILIVPFVLVYTEGINDANYNLPWFGILLTISHMFYCLRLPYSMIVLAAGHFKETQTSAIVEMLLNILISIVLVKNFLWLGLLSERLLQCVIERFITLNIYLEIF